MNSPVKRRQSGYYTATVGAIREMEIKRLNV